jgi:hypothetical protein
VLIPPPRRHRRSAHCFAGTKKDGGVPEGADPRDGIGNAPLRAAVTARAGLAVAGPPAVRANTLPATAREATAAKPRPHPRYLSALRLGRITAAFIRVERLSQAFARICLAIHLFIRTQNAVIWNILQRFSVE